MISKVNLKFKVLESFKKYKKIINYYIENDIFFRNKVINK